MTDHSHPSAAPCGECKYGFALPDGSCDECGKQVCAASRQTPNGEAGTDDAAFEIRAAISVLQRMDTGAHEPELLDTYIEQVVWRLNRALASRSADAVPTPGEDGEDEPEVGVQDWIAQLRDDSNYLDLNGGRYRLLDTAAGADLADVLESLAARLSSVGASAALREAARNVVFTFHDWPAVPVGGHACKDERQRSLDALAAALSQEARQ